MNDKITQLVNNGYQFDAVGYIGKAFEIFKKKPAWFLLYILILIIGSGFANRIPYAAVLTNLIAPVFTVGFALVSDKITKQEDLQFSDFFDGFNRKPVQLILTGLIMGVISTGIMLFIIGPSIFTIYTTGMNDFTEISNLFANVNPLLMLWGIIPIFYLSIAWMWSTLFIVFYDMDFWDAMEASRKVITKKWFHFFGLMILILLINILGVIPLGLGLFITIPVSLIVSYSSFEAIVGTGHELDPEDEIIRHLVD